MTVIDQFGHLADDPTPHLPPGARVRRRYTEDIKIPRPQRYGPHPLAPPAAVAWCLWLFVLVVAAAAATRLVLILF